MSSQSIILIWIRRIVPGGTPRRFARSAIYIFRPGCSWNVRGCLSTRSGSSPTSPGTTRTFMGFQRIGLGSWRISRSCFNMGGQANRPKPLAPELFWIPRRPRRRSRSRGRAPTCKTGQWSCRSTSTSNSSRDPSAVLKMRLPATLTMSWVSKGLNHPCFGSGVRCEGDPASVRTPLPTDPYFRRLALRALASARLRALVNTYFFFAMVPSFGVRSWT